MTSAPRTKTTLLPFALPLLALALSACLAGGPTAGEGTDASALATDEISVTTLDGPAPEAATEGEEGKEGEEATPSDADPAGQTDPNAAAAAEATADPEEQAADASAEPAAEAGEAPEAEAAPDAEPEAEPEAEPPPPVSPEEAACLKKKRLWIPVGEAGLHACVKAARDAGQSCRTGLDCQGECLARSMTCAPYDPLFGCNEVVQDNGVRTTLCLQ